MSGQDASRRARFPEITPRHDAASFCGGVANDVFGFKYGELRIKKAGCALDRSTVQPAGC